MSTTRRSGTYSPFIILLALIGLFFLVSSSSASPPEPSPLQEVDLICHTDNPADCYPKIFQPTEEFQIVHEDQQIPNGLHVRLDISTGKREAKLNDPNEQNPDLEGLPVDKGIVTVETEDGDDDNEPLFMNGAPVYESFGKVKPPPDHETGEFFSNLDFVRKGPGGKDLPFDEALEFLEDISHDIFYGGKIAENPATVQALLCLMIEGHQDDAAAEGVKPRGQQAASIIAAALQNNPAAAADVGGAWGGFMDSTCPGTQHAPEGKKLRETLYDSFMPRGALDAAAVPASAARAKAQVAAFNSLLKNEDVRRDFLANGGMDKLVETLAPTVAEWEVVQRKVGHLLLDNFLDEELGAVTGEWPAFRAGEKDAVTRRAAREADERWLEAIRGVRDRNPGKKSHWSVDVLGRLEKLHQKQLKTLPKEEL